MTFGFARTIAFCGLLALAAACGREAQPTAASVPAAATAKSAATDPDLEALRARASTIFGVLPAEAPNDANPITEAKIELGRALYYDTRFSKSQQISCNSCHGLDSFGVDNEPTSPGHEGRRSDRNSPTVYNAAFHVAQFWDGRAADVEEQAQGPVTNPVEMGMPDAGYVERVLESIPGYEPMFRAAFPEDPDPVSFATMARAIAAFERRLTTPSRFDDFLNGKLDALTDAEVEGLKTFVDVGCSTCHVGPTVGGTLFQKLGVVHAYETADPGRSKVTGQYADRRVFKVPALRNVAKTGPYFHDGSVATLEDATRRMGWHQLGRELSDGQVAAIVAFLDSLTGRIDAEYIARPQLPESGPETPTPDAT